MVQSDTIITNILGTLNILVAFRLQVGQHLGNIGGGQFTNKIGADVIGGPAIFGNHEIGLRSRRIPIYRSGKCTGDFLGFFQIVLFAGHMPQAQ